MIWQVIATASHWTHLYTDLLSAHRWRRGFVRRGALAVDSSRQTLISKPQCSDQLLCCTGYLLWPSASGSLLKNTHQIFFSKALHITTMFSDRLLEEEHLCCLKAVWETWRKLSLILSLWTSLFAHSHTRLRIICDQHHATHLGNLPPVSVNLEHIGWAV